MAYCGIQGVFKKNSKLALKKAQSMGAWGACSYSIDPNCKDPFDTTPENEGNISFELFGRAPFDKLHKIAKAICEQGQEYRLTVSEWELPLQQ